MRFLSGFAAVSALLVVLTTTAAASLSALTPHMPMLRECYPEHPANALATCRKAGPNIGLTLVKVKFDPNASQGETVIELKYKVTNLVSRRINFGNDVGSFLMPVVRTRHLGHSAVGASIPGNKKWKQVPGDEGAGFYIHGTWPSSASIKPHGTLYWGRDIDYPPNVPLSDLGLQDRRTFQTGWNPYKPGGRIYPVAP
jgi:hypothetical protein